jgi:hypothetical protein
MKLYSTKDCITAHTSMPCHLANPLLSPQFPSFAIGLTESDLPLSKDSRTRARSIPHEINPNEYNHNQAIVYSHGQGRWLQVNQKCSCDSKEHIRKHCAASIINSLCDESKHDQETRDFKRKRSWTVVHTKNKQVSELQ